METAETNGVVDYHGFYVSQTFLTDLKNHHPLEAIRSYQEAALIIHAQEDEDIPKEHAARYFVSLQQRPILEPVNTHYIKEQIIRFQATHLNMNYLRNLLNGLESVMCFPGK